MPTDGTAGPIAAAVLLALAVAVQAGGAGVTGPPGGPADAVHVEGANFTFVPADRSSRQPGAEQASFRGLLTIPQAWGRVASITVRGPFGINTSACGARNVRAAGFDRGGNLSGSRTDESVITYIRDVNFSTRTGGWFEYVFAFYTNATEGPILSFDAGDQVVAAVDRCFTTPDQPGWYRVTATLRGTAPDGTARTQTYASDWVYICNCSSRADARAAIGPTPTPVPTPSPTPTPTPPNQGGAGFGPLATVLAAGLVLALAVLRAGWP